MKKWSPLHPQATLLNTLATRGHSVELGKKWNLQNCYFFNRSRTLLFLKVDFCLPLGRIAFRGTFRRSCNLNHNLIDNRDQSHDFNIWNFQVIFTFPKIYLHAWRLFVLSTRWGSLVPELKIFSLRIGKSFLNLALDTLLAKSLSICSINLE